MPLVLLHYFIIKWYFKQLLYSHEQLYIHIRMQKCNTAIKTSGHSSLEKYTSHFIWKGYEEYYCVRGELETEQNCNILTPTLLAITAFLSHSPGLLNRGLGVQPLLGHGSHSSIFSPTDLNFLSPGLYNNLTPTYFLRASQFALNSTLRQSRSPLITWYLWPDAPVIYTGAFLIWQLSRVGGQHATQCCLYLNSFILI